VATQQLLSRRKIGSRESLYKAKAWKDEEIAAVVAVKDGLLDQLTAEKALWRNSRGKPKKRTFASGCWRRKLLD